MLRVISLGAGVQSSTMALMADRGLFGERPDLAVFADTGDEPKKVYAWLAWLQYQLTYPVMILHPKMRLMVEDGSMLTYKRGDRAGVEYWRNLIPYFSRDKEDPTKEGLMNRKCTSNYKIRRIIKYLRQSVHPEVFRPWRMAFNADIRKARKSTPRREGEIAKDWAARYVATVTPPPPLIQTWIGISTDEAVRMKPSRDPWIQHRWPLLDVMMSRAGCLLWMERNGFPRPPKSACTYCPYHSDEQWLELFEEDREAFDEAVAHERRVQENARRCPTTKAIPYLHRERIPLDQVDFKRRIKDAPQLTLFDAFNNECEGRCGN
jgi:hypothetical protein